MPQLSAKEITILRLISEGKTSPEIGRELHITEMTVRNYVRPLYDKLGIWNRLEAGLWYAAHEAEL